MNIKQAKSIPITYLLNKMGHEPDRSRQAGNDIWYKSPFSPNENDASFHVNQAKNIWYDFGGGRNQGGNILDLVMLLKNCDLSNALAYLEGISTALSKSKQQIMPAQAPNQSEDGLTLTEVKKELSPALFQYIKSERKINVEIVREFISQVHFKNKEGKPYFAVGIKNMSGGYEIRNPYFKGSIGKKDMALFAGTSSNEISVFEGMFDFLSAVTYYGKNILMQNDVLILNSLSFQQQAISFLSEHPSRVVKMYLDNDQAGQTAFEIFKSQLQNKAVEPSFAMYLPHKDFNAFIIERAKGIKK